MIYAVIGTAPCWEEDYNKFLDFGVPHGRVVLNGQGMIQDDFDWWVSMDPQIFAPMMLQRREAGTRFQSATPLNLKGVTKKWSCENLALHGGSAAYAICFVGMFLEGAAVLVGCPMDSSGNVYLGSTKSKHEAICWPQFKVGHDARPKIARSMSGNTMDLLGYPTREWLDEHSQ